MAVQLLSVPIRKFIRDKGWDRLRPIQEAVIPYIFNTGMHVMIASGTASGKTEAAFLPILSVTDFRSQGVKVLYVSPLKALINDQFERMEEICRYLNIPVTRWHGDAARSAKNSLLTKPSGVLLITPESLEFLLARKLDAVPVLFSGLKFVVIDEIHAFLGKERGFQLQSILYRLKSTIVNQFRIIGLSATMGNYEAAKSFAGEKENTVVIADTFRKEIYTDIKYFPGQHEFFPPEMIPDLYEEIAGHKALVFFTGRSEVEAAAVKLKQFSSGEIYFAHHSSVDKSIREYAENFAKRSGDQSFSICATTTLELGIDIGELDKIILVNNANNVTSSMQRAGRSGREEGKNPHLVFYATDSWNLLQALACRELLKEGNLEMPGCDHIPYDILIHQILSMLCGSFSIKRNELIQLLSDNFSFKKISEDEIQEILDHLLKIKLLETSGKEIVIGYKGEHLVNTPEFFSVFYKDEQFKVKCGTTYIGEMPLNRMIYGGRNIFLAGMIWKIVHVSKTKKLVEVIPAEDGERPLFYGERPDVSHLIRSKMLEVIYCQEDFGLSDGKTIDCLNELRCNFGRVKIFAPETERPVVEEDDRYCFYSFAGSAVNRTLSLLFRNFGILHIYREESSSFVLSAPVERLEYSIGEMKPALENPDSILLNFLRQQPSVINFSKWGRYLPDRFKVSILKTRYFDTEETKRFLNKLKLMW